MSGTENPRVEDGPLGVEEKLKYLEFIQGAIARMAGNSFAFKGWTITLSAAIASFAAVEEEVALLGIVAATVVLFWALDGYYLWLERGYVALHNSAAALRPGDSVSFDMKVDKSRAARRWMRICLRSHLVAFYGVALAADIVAIVLLKEVQ